MAVSICATSEHGRLTRRGFVGACAAAVVAAVHPHGVPLFVPELMAQEVGLKDLVPPGWTIGAAINQNQSDGRDTAAVTAQDVASGAVRVLAEDPHSDFTAMLLDPVLDRPIAAVCARERQRWQVLDPAFAEDFAYLTRLDPGDLAVTGMSRDRQHWLIAYLRDDAPLKYFHYDRGRRAAQKR